MTNPSEWREPGAPLARWLLVAVTLACLLPFLNKAFHMDDPLFIWTARHIQSHPVDFYGFRIDWGYTEQPMTIEMQNPPLSAYYMAVVGSVLGWSENALHFGFLGPALALVLGTYQLARRFCAHPFAVALATVATPVFLLSSTSVMCDTMMAALWVWAVYFWMEGLNQQGAAVFGSAAVSTALAGVSPANPALVFPSPKEARLDSGKVFGETPKTAVETTALPKTIENPGLLFLSATLMGLCSLTKYFGMALIPLLAAYGLVQRRSLGRWLVFLLWPVVILPGYEWETARLYGHGLLWHATNYVSSQSIMFGWYAKTMETLAFSGGCIFVVLAALPWLWGAKGIFAGVIGLAAAGCIMVAMQKLGEFSLVEGGYVKWLFVAQMALFVVGGVVLLVLAAADIGRNRTSDSFLLLAWVVGVLLFVGAINWTVAGRNLLPLAPAAALLIVRRLEARPPGALRGWWWPLGISLAMSIMVGWADARQAGVARDAASTLTRQLSPKFKNIAFEGHWGFQYYMEELGAKPLLGVPMALESNEAVIVPMENTCLFKLPQDKAEGFATMQVTPCAWLSVHSERAGAGYYSDAWGPAPYVFGPARPETYWVLRVK